MYSQSELLLSNANRIVVVGPCGSGKSTFSRALATIRDLPVIHLDTIFWQPGWVRSPDKVWVEKQEKFIALDRWIIDGSYAQTLPLRLARAELVVHLDYPRWIYIARLLKRVIMSGVRIRLDMTQGCSERLDLDFLLYAWRFRDQQRPRIIDAIAASSVPELRLNHPLKAERALQNV